MFKFCLLVIAALALGPETVKGQLVGAVNATLGEFPHQVLLMLSNGRCACSGALISRRHFLTAGHCVTRSRTVGPVHALVGTIDRRRGGQTYGIVGGEPHPRFFHKNPPDWMYDIGIFTLRSPVVLSNHVGIARLPTNGNIRPGSEAVISAAGCISMDGPRSDTLQKLVVRIVDQHDCQFMMPERDSYVIHETHICTFAGVGRGTCDADSGAPLIQDGVVIGIAAGGIPCAIGFPDVFTKVYSFLPWIREVMDSLSHGTPRGGSSSRGGSPSRRGPFIHHG